MGGVVMEDSLEYRQRLLQEYKRAAMPLFRYLPWLEKSAGTQASSIYQGQDIGAHSIAFPVYDATLLSFIKEVSGSSLMDRNYRYIYTRNRIQSHEDERRLIKRAGWRDWNVLKGILSYYVLGGRTKAVLWSQAVSEGIFFLVLEKMKEIIEYWDKPFDC